MQGIWVYVVNMYRIDEKGGMFCAGVNSFYASKRSAQDKVRWLREEIKKKGNSEKLTANFQRVMFFKGHLKGGEFSDRCTICAAELAAGVPLTEPAKSSLEKP